MTSVYIFTEGKSINAVKNENVELTHAQVFCDCIGAEMWTSCILQHTPFLISVGLYQQLNYSLHLVTSSAFIGTVEDLERSVTLQQILSIY